MRAPGARREDGEGGREAVAGGEANAEDGASGGGEEEGGGGAGDPGEVLVGSAEGVQAGS